MTTPPQRFKNALYLNNAAVTLMAQGDYCHATEASKAALHLIKFLVLQAEASTPTTATRASSRLNDFEQQIVQTTMRRLASLSTSNKKPMVPIDVLCFDGMLSPHSRDLVGSTLIPTAIMINDASFDDIDASVSGTIPSIFLSNFALVHLCMSTVASTPMKDSLTDGALRLLNIGLGSLGVHQRTMEVTEGNMFVAISLLGNICSILQYDSGRFGDESLEIAQRELALMNEVSNQYTHFTSSFVPVAGAA